MKQQGRPDRNVQESSKREPIVHPVDPGAVSQIGGMLYQNVDPLFTGRGFTAPGLVSQKTSNKGSQGKY